jgi:hypothetical protein
LSNRKLENGSLSDDRSCLVAKGLPKTVPSRPYSNSTTVSQKVRSENVPCFLPQLSLALVWN